MPPDFCDVSVIIPAFRAAASLERALQSVAAQTLKPRQAVVVDDGSDDGTFETAHALIGHLDGIDLKVFRQANQGAGAARNRALQEASQPFVAFLDADDEWLAEKLARTMPYFAGTDHVLVSHNVLIAGDQADTLVDCARHFAAAGEGDRFASVYRRGYISTSTAVARRDAVLAVGGFDTSLPNAQDFDLWLALLGQPGATFHVFGEAHTRYHVTPNSIMSNTERRLRCCLLIAERYVPALKERPGSMLASLWFRIVAVHAEAFRADRARFGAVLRLPVNLIVLTAAALLGRPPTTRRSAIERKPTSFAKD
jgi:teichuronic acid biosynthesis glycosyltransferase TuaG